MCFVGSADRVLVPPWHGSTVQLEGTPAPVRDHCLCLCVMVLSFLSQSRVLNTVNFIYRLMCETVRYEQHEANEVLY